MTSLHDLEDLDSDETWRSATWTAPILVTVAFFVLLLVALVIS